MAVVLRVNGNGSGEGFLIAPDGPRTFPVPLGLRTDDGTSVSATLDVTPNAAGVALASTSVAISGAETDVLIHATAKSNSRNDTVLNVRVGSTLVASFNLTAIANPVVWFRGRFQARFATDGDPYNEPRGTSAGWNFALEGEPDFVPTDSVADSPTKPVGRVIRFNGGVPTRSHVPAIGVTVVGIQGTVGTSGSEQFTVGDPLIGAPVDLGPNTYFAANFAPRPGDPPPFETYGAGLEVMALFEFHLGGFMSGQSAALSDRPKASGIPSLSTSELAQYGVVPLSTFNSARKAALLTDYNALAPADRTGTPGGRNLAARIAHLGGDSASGIGPQGGTLPIGWSGKEEYVGTINGGLSFNPGLSAVVTYLAGYNAFAFFGRFLNYHSDEQCGQVHGSVTANIAAGVPPLQTGVYNADGQTTAAFVPLNPPGLTPTAIDTLLGGAPTAEKLVVTVSASYTRLVVSKCVVSNPAASPASWIIASRGQSFVGIFRPDVSALPRDLVYQILPPQDQRAALGSCEGVPFAPPPAVGFARLFADGGTWKLLLHAGTAGGAGNTYRAQWSGSPATIPAGCTPNLVEVLNPTIDFGNVEEGLTSHRQIVILNRSAANVTVSLPAIAAPFGAPGATSVVVAAGTSNTLVVSFTAGTPGQSGPVTLVLGAAPPAAAELDVTLRGTSVAVTPTDVVLVLDRSGSMADPAFQGFRTVTKTELRNAASQLLVDMLRQADQIGMVRFDTTAQIHMPLELAGDETTGAGRADAKTALMSTDLLPGASTSIGDGMIKGNSLLSGSARKAMLVLTDGMENTAPLIASVTLGVGVRVYAVGLGLPENIDVAKLSAVAGNTGGYLLVTGELDDQNVFRLHKFFAQILSGIAGDQIIVDPQTMIEPGEMHVIPFTVTEADASCDVVLLSWQRTIEFDLRAPDGSTITAATAVASGARYVDGVEARYYRFHLPAFDGDPARSLGQWSVIVRYPGPARYLVQDASAVVPARARGASTRAGTGTAALAARAKIAVDVEQQRMGRPYTVLVRARSSITLRASVLQRDLKPGTGILVTAYLQASGLPMTTGVTVIAHVTRPDGVTFELPLASKGHGRYEEVLADDRLHGVYHITIKAAGTSPGGYALTREQALTGVATTPVVSPEASALQDLIDRFLAEEQARARLFTDAIDRLAQALRALHPEALRWLPWLLVALIIVLLLVVVALGSLP